MVRRRATVTGLVLVLALVLVPALHASRATTAPSKTVLVYFVFTDQKLVFGIYRTSTAGNSELYIENSVARGDFAKFTIINRGKKKHGLSFLGKTFVLKPGAKAHFNKYLVRRGKFTYTSTTDGGKAFRGVFPVS